MLGIIGAMDIEIAAIKNSVENKTVTAVAQIEFVCGTIDGVPVCVAQCSPGKVNSALCTQIMIDRFEVTEIINVGVGCSLSGDIKVKDVVVATEVCQYDFDTSPVDGVRGLILNGTVKIPTDKTVTDGLIGAAKECVGTVHTGCIASGDTFIATQSLKDDIVNEFGAVSGEMEGGSIGHVCYVNKVPFGVLRSISDGGDEAAFMDYPTFKEVAAKISSGIILTYIKNKK